jgi:hypothetical protein
MGGAKQTARHGRIQLVRRGSNRNEVGETPK